LPLAAALPLAARRRHGRRRRRSARCLVSGAALAAAAPAVGEKAPAAGGSQSSSATFVAKRIDDIVICVYSAKEVWEARRRKQQEWTKDSSMLENDDESLQDFTPTVGDVVRFSGGALGFVIAINDLCFTVALEDPKASVAEKDKLEFMSKGLRPGARVPKTGGVVVDMTGNVMSLDTEYKPTPWRGTGEAAESHAYWFNDLTPLISRQRINEPMHVGVVALDAFVPIGRGQSMLLRLPPRIQREEMKEFVAHVIEAQAASDVQCVVPAPTPEAGHEMLEAIREACPSAAERLTVVAARSGQIGEMLLANNAACALAESIRERGGDALLILDLESMYRCWSELLVVTTAMDYVDKGHEDMQKNLDDVPDELGANLWKYVAKKNSLTAQRRTFLGCFLQRASRLKDDLGGGSLTLLAFARLMGDDVLSRRELETKIKSIKAMNIDEAIRKKAVDKYEEQLAALMKDGGSVGIPDDFIEECKAVTDGHVVIGNDAADDKGNLCWNVDLKESVPRGITSECIQNRPLHELRSLNFKMYLMAREEGKAKTECDTGDKNIDISPMLALSRQPVGDVMSVGDEAAMFLLALRDSERANEARPLAREALTLLARGRVQWDEATAARAVAEARTWAEAQHAAGVRTLADAGASAVEALLDEVRLRPLERKRVLAALENPSEDAEDLDVPEEVQEDPARRYASLHERLLFLRFKEGELLADLGSASLPKDTFDERLRALQARILEA